MRYVSAIQIQEFELPDAEMLAQIGKLRVSAWANEIPEAADLGCWLDDHDNIARHWVAFDGKSVVAAARMSIHDQIENVPESEVFADVLPQSLPAPIASINRLVVAPCYRRRGIATQLDKVRIRHAEMSQCACIVVETPSGEGRIRQLQSHGFERAGTGAPYTRPDFIVGRPAEVLVRYLGRRVLRSA